MSLRFLVNDTPVARSDVAPEAMLLDHLRLSQRLTGTKEGCAEGDCGACTVLVGKLTPDGVHYSPVNACIRPLATLHGCHVVTVEHLEKLHDGLSPMQQAMVDLHGSQCGFCTPGIVMSLTGHLMNGGSQDEASLRTALDGNLCRCTGYRPILEAAASVSEDNPLMQQAAQTEAQLREMLDDDRHEWDGVVRPADLDDLLAYLAETPQARIIAGATDVGLWVTKHLSELSPAVVIDHLDELKQIDAGDDLTLGACVTFGEAQRLLAARFPHLNAYLDRFAGPQIRATGTIGGNIANGSPIGDMPPVLIAMGAELTLRSAQGRRTIPLEEFFIDYGKQDRRPGEIVEMIRIPAQPEALHRAEKISKRQREDISAVSMGLRLVMDAGRIVEARLAYGGLAATPKRAKAAEAALLGQPWGAGAAQAAADALPQDFTPITDMRASAEYRMRVAGNLLLRAAEETA